MILRSIAFITALFAWSFARAQSLDTLVLTHQRIIAKVVEVAPDLVTYKLPDEDVLHKISKIDLIRICYANQKVEQSSLINFPVIVSPNKWTDVKIADRPEDVHGVYKVTDIFIPGSTFTEVGKNSLKMATAMMGGNIVQVNGSFQYASTKYTSAPYYVRNRPATYISYPNIRLYGQTLASVYTSKLPDSVAFRKLVQAGSVLSLVTHLKLRGLYKYSLGTIELVPFDFRLTSYTIEKDNIFINAKLPRIRSTKLHVNYFDKEKIIVSYRTQRNSKYHLLTLLIKPKGYVPAEIKKGRR